MNVKYMVTGLKLIVFLFILVIYLKNVKKSNVDFFESFNMIFIFLGINFVLIFHLIHCLMHKIDKKIIKISHNLSFPFSDWSYFGKHASNWSCFVIMTFDWSKFVNMLIKKNQIIYDIIRFFFFIFCLLTQFFHITNRHQFLHIFFIHDSQRNHIQKP